MPRARAATEASTAVPARMPGRQGGRSARRRRPSALTLPTLVLLVGVAVMAIPALPPPRGSAGPAPLGPHVVGSQDRVDRLLASARASLAEPRSVPAVPSPAAPVRPGWTQIQPRLSYFDPAMAYDAADGVVVLFQGLAGSEINSTWLFSDGGWSQIHPGHSPGPRSAEAMVYDAADREVVLFGGVDMSGAFLNDTWVFRAGNWTGLNASATHAPPGREFPSLSYDPTTQNVLLFGGSSERWYSFNCSGRNYPDTWTFSAGIWTPVAIPLANSPSARYGASLASDPLRGEMILFGGAFYDCPNNTTILSNDTWSYSGGQWNRSTGGTSPSARWEAGFAWDVPNASLLLFGGSATGLTFYPGLGTLNDTWRFQNGTWRNLSVAGPPTADAIAPMIQDPAISMVLLFGLPMWAFTNGSWALYGPPPLPPPMTEPELAYDAADGYVLLFGGGGPNYQTPVTWSYDGVRWTDLSASQTVNPPLDGGIRVTYDPFDRYVLAFGGIVNTTWAFRGGLWSELRTLSAPTPRYGASLAFDPLDGYALLFGGSNCTPGYWYVGCRWFNDTWEFAGGHWNPVTFRAGGAPSGRSYSTLAFDASSGSLVLFGGVHCTGGAADCRALNDTWTFAHGAWAGINSNASPSARGGAAMDFDPNNRTVVLFGGGVVDSYGDWVRAEPGTWTFDGRNWSSVTFPGPDVPPLATGAALAYLEGLREDVLFEWGNDAWLLALPAGAAAAVSVSATASPAVGDAPLPVQFDGHVVGGTPPFFFAWDLGDGQTAGGESVNHTYSVPGTFVVTVTVLDFSGNRSQSNLTVQVLPTLSVSASVDPLSGIAPLSVQMSATVHGGAGPFRPSWNFGDGSFGASLNASHTYDRAGTYSVSISVTDRFGTTAQAGPWTMAVATSGLPIAVTLGVTPLASYFGTPVHLSAIEKGGTPPYAFAWSGLPANCTGIDLPQWDCTPLSVGFFAPTVTVTDGAGGRASASASLVVLSPVLRIALSVSPVFTTIGNRIWLNLSSSGGVPPLRIRWELPPACLVESTGTAVCAPTAVGVLNAGVVVVDSVGQSAWANATFDVGSPPLLTGSTGRSIPWAEAVATGIALGAISVGIVGVLLARRGRRPRSPLARPIGSGP